MARRTLAAREQSIRLIPSWRRGLLGRDAAGEVLAPGPEARIAPTTFRCLAQNAIGGTKLVIPSASGFPISKDRRAQSLAALGGPITGHRAALESPAMLKTSPWAGRLDQRSHRLGIRCLSSR
jgi:hypothetical protein